MYMYIRAAIDDCSDIHSNTCTQYLDEFIVFRYSFSDCTCAETKHFESIIKIK